MKNAIGWNWLYFFSSLHKFMVESCIRARTQCLCLDYTSSVSEVFTSSVKKKKNSPMDKVKQSKHKQKKTHHCLSVSMGNWFQDLRWISDPKMVKSQWWITMLCAYSPHTSSCVLNCLFMPSILQCKCYPVELHCLERGDKTCWVEKAYIQSTVIWILSCRLSRSRGRQHIDPMGF